MSDVQVKSGLTRRLEDQLDIVTMQRRRYRLTLVMTATLITLGALSVIIGLTLVIISSLHSYDATSACTALLLGGLIIVVVGGCCTMLLGNMQLEDGDDIVPPSVIHRRVQRQLDASRQDDTDQFLARLERLQGHDQTHVHLPSDVERLAEDHRRIFGPRDR